MERFFVQAPSINAVRRALDRAPGGARVVGRFDRATIECRHTMSAGSYHRHWPVLVSRFEKAGLTVVARPQGVPDAAPLDSPSSENLDSMRVAQANPST